MKTEYIADCKSNYTSVEDILKTYSYKHYYDFGDDNVIYSRYEPKYLKYANGNNILNN
jgi:hypothetical protein